MPGTLQPGVYPQMASAKKKKKKKCVVAQIFNARHFDEVIKTGWLY